MRDQDTQTFMDRIDFNPDNQPVLQLGDRGPDVTRLKEALNHNGQNVVISPYFDENTQKAVLDIQRRLGYVLDGKVGHKTLTRLFEKVPDERVYWKQGDSGADIRQLQMWLKNAGMDVSVDGQYGPATQRAVIAFQTSHGLTPTGTVGKDTFLSLHGLPTDDRLLTQQDLEQLASRLSVPVAHVMAVNAVESRGSGFFENGLAAILYERHIMRRRLSAKGIDPTPHIRERPNLVNTKTGGYSGGVREYERLERAKKIHASSALESCSWGLFQVMGYHWEVLNYKNVDEYVTLMQTSERYHLEAFGRFVEVDPRLIRALREGDWSTFARWYNGPSYAKNQYDVKMAKEAHLAKQLLGLKG